MNMINLTSACNITTGKLDANAAVENGEYPYFTCAPEPLRIDKYAFDGDVILLAGNNAAGNFHCQRYTGKFNAYQRTYVITAKEGYDIDYVYYNLLINLQMLKKISQGSQTKFLTMEILNGFELNDIPYLSQKKIVSSLVLINQKIDNNSAICSDLESLAKLLYDYWFVQFDFPDENGKPYKSSGGNMVWNEELKRNIPYSWQVISIGDILVERPKSKIQVNELEDHVGKIPFFTSGEGVFAFDEPFVTGSNIFMNTGGNADVKCYLGEAAYSTDTWCINAGEYTFYLYMYLEMIRKYLDISFFAGTGLKHLQKEVLKKHLIAIPPKEIIVDFNETMEQNYSVITALKEENTELSSLCDFLLPMLMNGQVKIKEKEDK